MSVSNPGQKRADKSAQLLLRRDSGIELFLHRGVLHRAVLRVANYLDIQAFFVAKVIIDGGEIRAGALADVADRRPLIAKLSENFAGGFEQAMARVGGEFGVVLGH